MSQYTVITEGFGTFGSVSSIIVEGYLDESSYPVYILLSDGLEYDISIAESLEYDISLNESLEYTISLNETAGG